MSSKITAIALRYDENMNAPELCTLARGVHAEEILKISRKFGIPVRKNPELVSKLELLPLKMQIPEDLYHEVAQIFISINMKK